MGGLDSHNARIDTGVDTERDCVLLCAQADTIGCKSVEYFVSGGATGMPRHQFQKSISDCKIRNVTANFNILQS